MKLKKLLLFVLLFLALLLLSSNVNAFVLDENGIGKYYLEDLPIDEEYYDTVFLYNSSNNTMTLFGVWNGCYLGFDRTSSTFYHLNSDNTYNLNLKVYVCALDSSTDKLIGGTWEDNYSSSDSGLSMVVISDYQNYEYVGGTGCIYPSSGANIIKSLPIVGNISWDSPMVITTYNSGDYDCKIYIPEYFVEDLVFKNPGSNAHLVYCRDPIDNTGLDLYCYGYSSSTDTWTQLDTVTKETWTNKICAQISASSSTVSDYVLFSSCDICNDSTSSVSVSNTNNLFSSLYMYKVFPYILNSEEDLAKGNDDVIVMPR